MCLQPANLSQIIVKHSDNDKMTIDSLSRELLSEQEIDITIYVLRARQLERNCEPCEKFLQSMQIVFYGVR